MAFHNNAEARQREQWLVQEMKSLVPANSINGAQERSVSDQCRIKLKKLVSPITTNPENGG